MAAILNYTTKVPIHRTITEIWNKLAAAGAQSVAVTYDEAKKPTGVTFQIATKWGDQVFSLPVDVAAVQVLLTRQRRENARVDARPEQAERVAWRIIKDWLVAQLTLIETGMVSLDQVMLPYLRIDGGRRTVYEAFQAQGARELGP